MRNTIEDLLPGSLVKEKSLQEGRLQIRRVLSETTRPGDMLYSMHYLGPNYSINFSSHFHEHLIKEEYDNLFNRINSYEKFRDLSKEYNNRKTEEYWAQKLGTA